jgi:SNF2 family DNA or RNA helicase
MEGVLIDYDRGAYVAQIRYEERGAFKEAGWSFDADRKQWITYDPEKAVVFQAFTSPEAHAALELWKRSDNGAVELSRALSVVLDKPIPVPPGLSYDPFQEAGIFYACQRKDTLIADPPGLGKTIQAVGVSNYTPTISSVLVVCPGGLKRNWENEWRKWCVKGLSVERARSITHSETIRDEAGAIVRKEDGKPKRRTWTEHFWPETNVVIVSYDMLPAFESEIRRQTWDMLVCDEAQNLVSEGIIRVRHVFGAGAQNKKKKGADGKVTKTRVPAVAPIQARKRLFLTGTPIMSRPIDIWVLCKACDQQGLGANWMTFVYTYCAASTIFGRLDISGASNLDKLQHSLRKKFMVRRDKKLAMKDMPPKRRQLIELPAEGLAKLVDREVSAMHRVREALRAYEASVTGIALPEPEEWTGLWDVLERRFGTLAHLDYEERARHLSPAEQVAFAEMSTARKELAAAKIPMVVEHLEQLLSSGEKVILFAVHTEVCEAIRKHFPQCAYITGNVNVDKRQAQVDRFQTDPTCNIMIGNLTAAGVGFTMTAACIVVCAELDWVPSVMEQAEDRAWRRGQQRSVLVQHLVVEGSLDAHLVNVLIEKQRIIDSALDAEINTHSIYPLASV